MDRDEALVTWCEPEGRLRLTCVSSSVPISLRLGGVRYSGHRWTRVTVRGPIDDRHRESEVALIGFDELDESWCAVDCGEAGTVVVAHRWLFREALCGRHWVRDMTCRVGPRWLYEVFAAATPGSTRDHVLTPVRLLPPEALGHDECSCEEDDFDLMRFEDEEHARGRVHFEQVPTQDIAAEAATLVARALATLDGDVTLRGLRAAGIHRKTVILSEYTGDSFTTDALRLSCDVVGSARPFRLMLSFSDVDASLGPVSGPLVAKRVISQNLLHDPVFQVWLVAPTDEDADVLGRGALFEPVGTPLHVRPVRHAFWGWDTAWAEPLLGASVQGPRQGHAGARALEDEDALAADGRSRADR